MQDYLKWLCTTIAFPKHLQDGPKILYRIYLNPYADFNKRT